MTDKEDDINDRLMAGTLPNDLRKEMVRVDIHKSNLQLVNAKFRGSLPIPNDVVAEDTLLAAILWAGQFAPERAHVGMVADLLTSAMFAAKENQAIYEVLVSQHEIGGTFDPVSIHTVILSRTQRTGALAYMQLLVGLSLPTTEAQLRTYAEAVRNAWARRELIVAARAIEELASKGAVSCEEIVDRSRERLDEVDQAIAVYTGLTHAKETVEKISRALSQDKAEGMKTGFAGIDNYIGGLVPGETTIVGARTSVGKSAFAFQMIDGLLSLNRGMMALYVSLEMSDMSLLGRAAAARSRVDLHTVRQNTWREGERTRFLGALSEIEKKDIWLADTQSQTMKTITALVQKANVSAQRKGKQLAVVVIDHVLLIKPPPGFRHQKSDEVAGVSRWMKGMADAFKIAVVGLSQVGRESEKQSGDKRPELHHLKYSGALEEDADNVILLHRNRTKTEGFVDEPAQIIVAKARNGRVGTFWMNIESRFALFSNLEEP